MEDKKITTRTAILAKKIGFNQNSGPWHYKGISGEKWTNNKGGLSGNLDTYVKCSQTKLAKWLRTRHKIFVTILDYGDGISYWPKLVDLENDQKNSFAERLSYKYFKENEKAKFNSYEKALEVGLYDALKIIEKRLK